MLERPGRANGDVVTGAAFLLVGLGAAAGGLRLGIGAIHEPQAGFLPFIGGVLLVALSSILIVEAFAGRSRGTEPFGSLAGPGAAVAALVLYVAVLRPLGYVPATFVLCVVLLRVLGVRRLVPTALAAFIVSAGTYLFFRDLLAIPLPPGLLPLDL